MPDIKHHFRIGRMNKDLDKRLVPNGEYRDANNIDITVSEGSDIGSVQNVLGNSLVNNKTYNALTQTISETWDADAIQDLTNPVCIGTCKDTENDKIYWLVASDEASCIAEYNSINNEIKPIIVDKLSILKFNKEYPVHGVNVLEGLIAWTDGQTDPKKINIEKFKAGSKDFSTHTVYDGTLMSTTARDSYISASSHKFDKTQVTTIKLSPKNAPKLTMSSSIREGIGSSTSSTTFSNYDFSSIGVGGVVSNITFSPEPIFLVNDKINLVCIKENDNGSTVTYNVSILITELLNNANSVVGTLISKSSSLPSGKLQFTASLDSGDVIFEKKLVRFAYRWKYIDGEYSTFSPFSEVAFIPSTFKYISDDGYNNGMLNSLRSLTVGSFDSKPIDVDLVEVLYKESNSNAVYLTHTISDSSTSYKVESEVVGLIIQSNQILRPWDNVPLKAKAQEVVGNRLIYGNYTQNYTLNKINNPNIKTVATAKPRISAIGIGEKSIKSDRTYQVGVVYSDLYSRETPVFSSTESAVTIDKSRAELINKLSCRLDNPAPSWATHYKYFVKETSNEYYNLALDRFYLTEDDSVWLSFPSSERNKVKEDGYLNLKKKHDSDSFVAEKSKYKILDISNEAPNSIAKEVSLVSSFKAQILSNNESNSSSPRLNSSYFKFRGPTDIQDPDFAGAFNSKAYLSITSYTSNISNGTTEKYKIISGGINGEADGNSGNTTIYEVYLEKGFSSNDSNVLKNNVFLNNEYIKIDIHTETLFYKPEFSGRFFVKVNRDAVLEDAIIDSFKTNESSFSIVNSKSISLDSTNDFSVNNTNNESICWTDSKADSELGGSNFTITNNRHPTVDSKSFTILLSGVDTGFNDTLHNLDFKVNSFLGSIEKAGTHIQFSNSDGFSGSVYKITSTSVVGDYRSEDENKKKSISGKRRIYTVNIENVVDGEGYSDKFKVNGTGDSSIITNINIMKKVLDYENDNLVSENPAIFETEASEGVDLDLYYEISDPMFILKPGMKIKNHTTTTAAVNTITGVSSSIDSLTGDRLTSVSWTGSLNPLVNGNSVSAKALGYKYRIISEDGLYYEDVFWTGTATTSGMTIDPDSNIHGFNNELDWFNCYSFGNGVESNRIQDDFNAPFIDKSPIVSSTIKTQYKEDKKTNGLIFSGIINSTSDVNDLNQFIQAEAITKDLNPEYGSIQRLLARDTDLILFCEDKVIRVLANKDAIYNADGNPNLTASNNVLGQTIPYLGEYGVGKNPESISSFGFRIYFADKSRGCVLRLSRDGITEISEKGMSDWFKDNLKLSNNLIGSFDEHKNVYNLTINNYTICFNERVDGWTSFKSFIPEFGLSLNNIYYTFKNGVLYSHNNQLRNNFYGIQYDSSVTTLLNDFPSLIKSFKTLNYEGSLSRLYTYNSDYSSSTNTTGWYANKIASDVQSGSVKEFTEKEGLWTNYVIGDSTTESNVDVKESSVQGIGFYQAGTLSGDINRTQVNITKTLATVDADIVGKITISDSVKLVQNINTTASTTSTFTIKPLTGYLLTHTNFSGSGCTFSQSGSNVICNLTRTYVVVTSDVIDTVNISHNGALTSAGYDLGLTYKTHEENTQSSNRSVLATYSGSYNVQSQLFTVTILADIDSNGNFTHEFSTKPSFAIIYSNGESGDTMYTVTDNWSDATSTSVTFTVNYKFGSKNVVGDEILFLCKATKKTQAVGNIITGVNVSTTDLHVTGGSRSIKVTGTPGAKFEIYYYKEKWHTLGNSFINSTGRYIYRETGTYANTWEYNSGNTGYNSLYTFPSSGVKEIPWSSDTDLSIFQGNKVPYKYVFAVRVGQENRNPIPGGEAQPLHYPFTSRSFVQYDASGNIVGDGFPGTNYVNYSVWKDNVRNTNTASASDTATLTFDSIPALIGSNSSWNLKRVSWSGMPGGVNLAVTSTPVLANSIYTVTLKEYKKLSGTSGYAWTDYNVAVPDNTPVTFSDPYDFEIWQRPNGIINLKIQNTDPNITAAVSYPTANITAPTAAFATAVVTGRTSSSQSATSSISNSTDLPVSTSTLPLNYAVLSTEIIEEVLIYGSASNVITLSSPQTITSGASVILSERTNALAISNVVKSSNIEVGDIVVSTNLSGGGINKLVKVATVTNQTTLVLDSAIGLYNGMTLAFFKPTAEATYNISSSYANHEPTSASNKYLVNFEAVFQAKNGYQLYENEKLQAEDFKYEKASVIYSGVDTNSGTTLTFSKVTTSTANINGTVSGQNYLDIDNLVGTINVGDSVTGTGVASGVFVTVFSSPTVTFNTNVSLSNDIALTFTNTSKTDLPDSIYAPAGGYYGSSIQYNTYDSSGVATLHTNNVSAINRTTNVVTLRTAISAHTVTSGTIFIFNKTTPNGWNFNIKNINGKVDTAAINNKYTISADFEFLKYSENTILSEINIDKLIRVALPATVVDIVSGDPAPDPIVTEPPAVNQTKKVSFDLIPQNDIISAIALDGNKAIVQSTPQTLRGTGYITAELNGNNFAIGGNSERQPENQITLISIVDASYTFEMYSLALDPNARDTWGTGTATTGLNGLGSSQINFSWSLTLPSVAANDNISVKIGVNKLGSSGTGGFA